MKKYTIETYNDHIIYRNNNGATIAIARDSEVDILEVDGYAFKDLDGNGILDPYEDWRLDYETRIDNLIEKMKIKDIAGLMLYSSHMSVTVENTGMGAFFAGTYGGKCYDDSDVDIWELTDQQKEFIVKDYGRHILLTQVDYAEISAMWSNGIQSFCERQRLGIPANISSDPRHTASANTEYDAGAGGDISIWPQPLGLAATFDSELVRTFGKIASKEYRAIGVTTALSPQIDLATEPRWSRFSGTFGENTKLATAMAEAYCDGFQTTGAGGWGSDSVNAMVKHWPGGGSGEGGRDAHFGYGKFAVYPGDNFDEHLKPFINGAFKLTNGTNCASAVMPYYTISYNQDKKNHDNIANAFSEYIIDDLLRKKYEYDGVVCSDWNVILDIDQIDSFLTGKSFGVEDLSLSERYLKALLVGVDQFGGVNKVEPIMEAYKLGSEKYGETNMRNLFEESARRLLRNIFRCNLFENPYLNPQDSDFLVGCPEHMDEGYTAQQKSIILLKNNECLPMQKKKKVYIPKRRIHESIDWFGRVSPAREEHPLDFKLVEKYYEVVEDSSLADFSIVCIDSPKTVGYKDGEYYPISLQYKPYTAKGTRIESIASDKCDKVINRSYEGKTTVPTNSEDLNIILETRDAMPDKPVIVVLNAANPTIVKEFEDKIDGLLIHFSAQTQAILDCICGDFEPQALLPFQMPKDMLTVEQQAEDVAGDMECHVDTAGNVYDFAFGMNYTGVIQDERVNKYK